VCVSSISPPPGPGEDCASAQKICNKASLDYTFYDHGSSNELPSCFLLPVNSDVWITFTVGVTGTLEWEGIPLNTTTEWDWALFDLGTGGACLLKTERECDYYTNAADGGSRGFGMVLGADFAASDYEPPLTVTAGRTYAIMIDKFNNFAYNQGFELNWDGTFQMAPASVFTVTPKQACGTLTAAFTNISGTGISTYLWNFGDGTTFTAITPPNHTYSTPGNYLISLTTTSATGCTNSSSQLVSVTLPVVTVTAVSPTICAGQSTVLIF
jgi:hypothetical protein